MASIILSVRCRGRPYPRLERRVVPTGDVGAARHRNAERHDDESPLRHPRASPPPAPAEPVREPGLAREPRPVRESGPVRKRDPVRDPDPLRPPGPRPAAAFRSIPHNIPSTYPHLSSPPRA